MTMKIHFTSSNSKEAISLKSKYSELYNQANLREADVIVAIGGDGEMLKALRLAIKNNSSVFGLNKGHIGFLMNKINKTNLIKRINKASQLTVHPLEMECFDYKGKKIYTDNKVNLAVIKGKVEAGDSESTYKIDGLSGATITSRGVTNMVAYWFGESGYSSLLRELDYES